MTSFYFMTTSIFKTICLALLLSPTFILGQEISLDQFKTTKAVGEPPSIFKQVFQDKVEYRKGVATEVKEEYKEEYAKYSTYSLDHLLKSGYVLYGDPMTIFVQKVGKKLLEKSPELKGKLQFYVIKNNMTNALCTGPGVIFVTTGLLAQIENEAQLAFVMSHEIVHYQENHLEKSFNQAKEKGMELSTSYEDMVKLFKDNEFEADVHSLKFYYAAGYSKKEINTVFDVLMYSYLSFDEIDIDSTFFGNPNIYVPQSYFPEKKNPILAFEDYDDSKSTHPNIRKRRDTITDELRKYDNWKTNVNFMSKEEFDYVQNIARFETVRENVILGNYIEALYEIYILEKQFPNNEYLQTTKAIVWSTMNQVSLSGRRNSYLSGSNDKEGVISLLYGFFKKLTKQELALLTVREVEDIYKKLPESKIVKEMRDETIKDLAHDKGLELNRLEKISYREALSLRDEVDTIIVVKDSISPEEETKYDRIRRIREEQSSSKSITELVDKNFSQFLLYDLVSNRTFNELYDGEKKKIKEEKEKVIPKEKKHAKKVKYEGDIFLLNPHLVALDKGNKFDLDNTLEFYNLMALSIEKQAPEGRLQNKGIALSEKFTTKGYNEASLLMDYVLQLLKNENNNFTAVNFDYEEMDQLLKGYNNPYLLLIAGTAKKYSGGRNSLSGFAKYINLMTGEITSSNNYFVAFKIRKLSVGGLVNEAFSKF